MADRNLDDFAPWRKKLRHIIFDHNTPASKGFDIALLWLISLAVLATMLESVDAVSSRYGTILTIAEWVFTILFMLEYFLRLVVSLRPVRYATSFYGIIDFFAWIPAWIGIFFQSQNAHYFAVIRVLRLLRIFRILKMISLIGEADRLMQALRASRSKIFVFIFFVFTLVTILGSVMYIVEGPYNEGFSSIPTSVYWAIITVTTVGFGDITPVTVLGQIITSVMMLIGYAIIAVPTGIVIGSMRDARDAVGTAASGRSCPECGREGHRDNANHCWQCGGGLEKAPVSASDPTPADIKP
jgi:voltage-gated potassium channel